MKDEIISFQNLPSIKREVLMELKVSPERFYNALPTVKPDTPYSPSRPALSEIKKHLGKEYVMLAVSVGIMELREWFNVKNTISDSQIALTAELIAERFYDYSLNEIKSVFRKKMMDAKLYDRLDGNIIISWLTEYDLSRDNDSEQTAMDEGKKPTHGITHDEYMEMLKSKASKGDKEAIETINDYIRRSKILSKDELEQQEINFHNFLIRHNVKNESDGRTG